MLREPTHRDVYTSSSLVLYLDYLDYPRYKLAHLLNIDYLPDIEKGKVNFTLWQYYQIVNKFPQLEGSLEGYEDVDRLSDEDYSDMKFEMEKII